MRLSKFSDYALRVALYLAAHPERLVPIGEIARAHGLSQSNLMKVVYILVDGDILQSVRGRHGGVRLARAPEHISVGEIIGRLEHHDEIVDCRGCILERSCTISCMLSEARAAFYASLSRHSLADVMAADPQIREILIGAGKRGRAI